MCISGLLCDTKNITIKGSAIDKINNNIAAYITVQAKIA